MSLLTNLSERWPLRNGPTNEGIAQTMIGHRDRTTRELSDTPETSMEANSYHICPSYTQIGHLCYTLATSKSTSKSTSRRQTMSLTLDDRRDLITRARVHITNIREEVEICSLDTEYICQQLQSLTKIFNKIDKDGPAPDSTALRLTEELKEMSDSGATDKTQIEQALTDMVTKAERVEEVDAIPGVYPYKARLLTFQDGSQAFFPEDESEESVPAFHLVEKWQVSPFRVAGDSLPAVVDPDSVLSPEQAARMDEILENAFAPNTRINLESRFRHWVNFATSNDLKIFPAHPAAIVLWIVHQFEQEGKKSGTVQNGLNALRAIHEAYRLPNPCSDKRVKNSMNSMKRDYGTAHSQMDGMTWEELQLLEAHAYTPRITHGGKMERKETAERRGHEDTAIAKTLYSGVLRPSEAANLKWGNLEVRDSGDGILTIVRSKTDQGGKGAKVLLPRDTVQALLRIKGDAGPEDRIFPFSQRTLSRRLKAALKAAGVEGRFAGHSGRIGMALDLIADGATLPQVMQAGRWKSKEMPATYGRNERPHRIAVARFYQKESEEDNA